MNEVIEKQVREALERQTPIDHRPAITRAFLGGSLIGPMVVETKAQRAARSEATHRLVKASKCPTKAQRQFERAYKRQKFQYESLKLQHCEPKPPEPSEVEKRAQITPTGQTGCATIVEFREWSDEWRIRTQAETANNVPPQVDGERISEMLSQRGAKKIAESCEYMSAQKGGYKTFVTGTFNDETRARIAAGETTIQGEVSRCMDAMQKMYRRGWTMPDGTRVDPVCKTTLTRDNKTMLAGKMVVSKTIIKAEGPFSRITPRYNKKTGAVIGWTKPNKTMLVGDIVTREYNAGPCSPVTFKAAEGLAYSWVVEVPTNENGEENPHVHMLLGWQVPYKQFESWAERIERIWGNGYFHLEKIKDCTCAGAYMAKAAGYMTKAEGSDSQGKVRGNRYGISEPARAPDWVTIGKAQLHAMGQIIADVYDHLTQKNGADYKRRKQLNKKLEDTPKTERDKRHQIGQRLQAVREKLNALPVRCNKYQIILKGEDAKSCFMSWAMGDSNRPPEWLPELPKDLAWEPGATPGAKSGHYWRNLKKKFQEVKRRRHAVTNETAAWMLEQWEQAKRDTANAWAQFAGLDLCQ
ncbi:hypothetical protein [Marinimicrobium sp. C2-29]|uniref:hypothetical protein n=1 Tax=Marinimicrobium sp. C2-29 TaxID=3139825 RepID=UPI0031398951